MRFLLTALLFVAVSCGQAFANPGFDFTHVEKAIAYFETGDETLLEEIAASDAAQHLKKHSDRTGYYEPDVTSLDITRDLLKALPDGQTLAAVKELVAYAKANPERIAACFSEPEKFLPEGVGPQHPVYITWGYDIGVSMDGTASLNFAHPRFLANIEEIWFYCIHENHHAGVMQLHPMTPVSGLKTAYDLYEFTRYSTMLEGMAVYAAYGERKRYGALDSDPDYVTLRDSEKLEKIAKVFFISVGFLENHDGAPLDDFMWLMVEKMSSGDRWWYVTGAHMARAIDENGGREALLKAIEGGPEAFFKAYQETP